jgi:hypothetical protein
MRYAMNVQAKRSHPFQIRLTAREFVDWKRAAKRSGQPIAEWIRALGNAAAVPAPQPIPAVVSGDQTELRLENGKAR